VKNGQRWAAELLGGTGGSPVAAGGSPVARRELGFQLSLEWAGEARPAPSAASSPLAPRECFRRAAGNHGRGRPFHPKLAVASDSWLVRAKLRRLLVTIPADSVRK